MSGNQKQVKRSRKQTARAKRHALHWTAPLLGAYAIGAPSGWADTLDAATLESNRTDLQRAILPTAPAGIMQDITPIEPLKDGIARITVEVDRNNVPADGQSPVKLRIRAFDADNQGVMGESFVNVEVSAGRLQLPGARSDEKGLFPADLNPLEPGRPWNCASRPAPYVWKARSTSCPSCVT